MIIIDILSLNEYTNKGLSELVVIYGPVGLVNKDLRKFRA